MRLNGSSILVSSEQVNYEFGHSSVENPAFLRKIPPEFLLLQRALVHGSERLSRFSIC
jgi:hypothetical protein